MYKFINYCKNGNLELAKDFLQTNPNMNNFIENAFQIACEYGKLNIAQWLFNLKPNILNSGLEWDEYAFKMACHNGHLELAQWLLSVKPKNNIKPYFHTIFLFVCISMFFICLH